MSSINRCLSGVIFGVLQVGMWLLRITLPSVWSNLAPAAFHALLSQRIPRERFSSPGMRPDWPGTCWPLCGCSPASCASNSMLFSKTCETCLSRGRLHHSEMQNFVEFVMSPLIVPCRCANCCIRTYRMRHIPLLPHPAKEAPRKKSGPGNCRSRRAAVNRRIGAHGRQGRWE